MDNLFNKCLGKQITELSVGERVSITNCITDDAISCFAEVTGDKNPVHLDDYFAKNTKFKQRIAHGMLLAGFISSVIGMYLPGPGCVYASQCLKFLCPDMIGDEITTTVEVAAINLDKNRITLKTTCFNQHGNCVLDGTAVVLPRKA